MPKVKTNSAAKKRFKLTGTGKIKRQGTCDCKKFCKLISCRT